MQGQNIVSELHLNSGLNSCEGAISINATYYNQEKESFGDSIPVVISEKSSADGKIKQKVIKVSIPLSDLDLQIFRGFAHKIGYETYNQITSIVQL